MEDFVPVVGIVLLVLLGPWVLVWRANSRRRRERGEDQERWRELTSRTYALEQTVRALHAQRPSPASEGPIPKTADSRHVNNRFHPEHGYSGPRPARGDKPEPGKRLDKVAHFKGNEVRDGRGHTVGKR